MQRLPRQDKKLWLWATVCAAAAAGTLGLTVGGAGTKATLTHIPSDAAPMFSTNPIGIDWLPGSAGTSGNVLISVNYPFGSPINFQSVNPATGTATTFSSQSGWTDEIYFASVRPGSPSANAGWTVGNVYSANTTAKTCIAQFSPDGTTENPCWATIAGETRDKRGGLMFDGTPTAVAGGDLIVVASNDGSFGIDSKIYRINHLGVVTLVASLPVHAEGVFVVPVGAAYGALSGMIVVGNEFQRQLQPIPPGCNNICVLPAPVSIPVSAIDQAGPNLDQLPEDIWVIPATGTFYGVDHNEGSNSTGIIWTGDLSAWAGQLLLAEEHGARLFTFNPVANTITQIYDGLYSATTPSASQWEHITFVTPFTPPPPPSGCNGPETPPCQTVTQGGWAAPPNGNNPGTILNAFYSSHPAYNMVIGCSVGRTLTFNSANAIRNFLPQGSKPGVLAANALNPTKSAANVFGGQVLAMEISVTLSNAGNLPAGLGGTVLTAGPAPGAIGKTIQQVLDDANKAIGGCGFPAYAPNASALNDLVDYINNLFD